MKAIITFLSIFLLTSVFGQTITRDFATVQSLRSSNYWPHKGEKIFVKATNKIYYFDHNDTTSPDDSVNCIVQLGKRWKPIGGSSSGSGDMLKSTYDTNNNGVVDNASMFNNQSPSFYLDKSNHIGTDITVVHKTGNETISGFKTFVSGANNSELSGNGLFISNGSKQINLDASNGTISMNRSSAPTGSNQILTRGEINTEFGSQWPWLNGFSENKVFIQGTNFGIGIPDSTLILENYPYLPFPDNIGIRLNTDKFKTIGGQHITGVGNIDLNKSDVGLPNVDNTSDINKPISTATQTALNLKQSTLISGTNIKTINGTNVLGSGDLSVSSSGMFVQNMTVTGNVLNWGTIVNASNTIGVNLPTPTALDVGKVIIVTNTSTSAANVLSIYGIKNNIANSNIGITFANSTTIYYAVSTTHISTHFNTNLGDVNAASFGVHYNAISGDVNIANSSNSAVNIKASAPGTVNINTAAATSTTNINTGLQTNGTSTINIATGGSASGIKNLNLGTTNFTSTTTINSGSGGLLLNNLTTGTVNIANGPTVQTVNINTGSGVKTTNLGSTNTTSTTTINTGTGGLAFGGLQTVTGATSTNANTNATVLIGKTYLWDDGSAIHLMIKK